MKEVKKAVPVQTNLIQQNCYRVDLSFAPSNTSTAPDKFVSIDEQVTADGIKLVETVQDYPITPDYVNSFRDSADYRNDPLSAAAFSTANPRKNLGDIRELQAAGASLEDMQSLYKQLSKKFGAVNTSATPKKSIDNKNEVSNNE
ncbi:hypothetical protein [Sigmofec virus UA08Rod_5307]|uniref:Uncharacterized protein n=1 Tax=Sigmofec virus UA08Rod_5307 TaxID=2929418 RepID=A0A976R8L4_9VIRU|nr:hypothetical protein [Sigmofec virus UA08Rod_5307]